MQIEFLCALNGGLIQLHGCTVSHTPDQDSGCFYPWEIILSHIPVPACGKYNKRTATHWLYAGRTSIPDVIVMIKWLKCSHLIFWKPFSFFSNIVVNKKKINYFYEGGIENSVPSDHNLSSLYKPDDANRWSLGRIFLSHRHSPILSYII